DNHGPVYVNNAALSVPGLCKEANIQLAALPEDGRLLVLVSPCRLAPQIGQSSPAGSAARSAIGMAEMLAHEIKNPLAGITGAAQLLEMGLSAADRELTGLIVAEGKRIVALLDQVEQFGNLRPPELGAENIHHLLDRARRSAAVGFAQKVVFKEEYDPSLPLALVDGDQMMQVFLNLMKNAAEALQRDGRAAGAGKITLRSYYDHALRMRGADGQDRRLPLQIEIIDNGPGLPDDIAAQIFEPFVSGRENGTGLGLALVSKILSEHGAWINVESAPGRTCFRISLPLAVGKGAAGRKAEQTGEL
ncbi:MAG TPA: PAS domain-containing sensor histidine kinase, partial [Aliiroseovarius sp.]|nr:PAS domain-containing sensor histidine kinase [Aliiroseovarius sp.]